MNHSLFDDECPSVVALAVHNIVNDPIDWKNAHRGPTYLDVVKVKYRTSQIEYPKREAFCKLPAMLVEEFGSEMHKYNVLVDRFGNRFEVIVQERDGDLYFTHGWSQIRRCYVDGEFGGGWASLTYIRPKLFILILKDRYYRDLMARDMQSSLCFNLPRSLYGPDGFPGCVQKVLLPYLHDSSNFLHSFHMYLTKTDVSSGFLTMFYENLASKLFSKDAKQVKLIDEGGLEWNCTLQYFPPPHSHVKVGGEWMSFERTNNVGEATHLIFGTKNLGKAWELYVKKFI